MYCFFILRMATLKSVRWNCLRQFLRKFLQFKLIQIIFPRESLIILRTFISSKSRPTYYQSSCPSINSIFVSMTERLHFTCEYKKWKLLTFLFNLFHLHETALLLSSHLLHSILFFDLHYMLAEYKWMSATTIHSTILERTCMSIIIRYKFLHNCNRKKGE